MTTQRLDMLYGIKEPMIAAPRLSAGEASMELLSTINGENMQFMRIEDNLPEGLMRVLVGPVMSSAQIQFKSHSERHNLENAVSYEFVPH